MESKYLALQIAYNGAKFYGFAPQIGLKTVMSNLQDVLVSLGIYTQILAAGRTDKGVHATGQVIALSVPIFWDLIKLQVLLNQKLYPHTKVRKIWEVGKEFHPRFSALMREYRYLFTGNLKNIFLSELISQERMGDERLLREAMECFVGEHDFGFFHKTGSDAKNSVRKIYRIRLYEHRIFKERIWIASFLGNGFLYSQIRLMMGAILAYSRREITIHDILKQLRKKERIYSIPVSPNGLYLSRVVYPENSLKANK